MRWYDTLTGRWIEQDPSGVEAGDYNLQRCVGNGPTDATDPTGLELPARGKQASEDVGNLLGGNTSPLGPALPADSPLRVRSPRTSR